MQKHLIANIQYLGGLSAVPIGFFKDVLRIRKEIIELNSHLQTLDILYTAEKIRGKKIVCDDAEFVYDERPLKIIQNTNLMMKTLKN